MYSSVTFAFISSLFSAIHAVDIHNGPQDFCYSQANCSFSSKLWPDKSCQNGKFQSPINLKGNETTKDILELPLGHFDADHFFLQNNGHTLNVDFAAENDKGDNGHLFPGEGISRTKYRLYNVHFHWGTNDSVKTFY